MDQRAELTCAKTLHTQADDGRPSGTFLYQKCMEVSIKRYNYRVRAAGVEEDFVIPRASHANIAHMGYLVAQLSQ
jgi:hypothetical protein